MIACGGGRVSSGDAQHNGKWTADWRGVGTRARARYNESRIGGRGGEGIGTVDSEESEPGIGRNRTV